MTRIDIDEALAAANPLRDRTAALLPLDEAEAELTQRIVAIAMTRGRPRPAARSRRRRRRLALLVAVTAAVAAALALAPFGHREGGPSPAFAASLVRFANASPLVLLKLPGWHVVYANEETNGFGEMHFVRGPADAEGTPRGASFSNTRSLAGRVAQLTWAPLNVPDRSYFAGGHRSLPTGLGVTVHRLVGEGTGRGWLDISALFVYRGRGLTFRATVRDFGTFRAELLGLTGVDTTTWLRAMPPSVVDAADSAAVIRAMLKGIPLPPGFHAARIRGARLVHDRYQLGAAVTGTVACMWIADWSRARRSGDRAMVKRAIAAMATAPHWPILRWMARQGAWSQVLISYAQAMPRGTFEINRTQPLTAAADEGLGCALEWGISLRPGDMRVRRLSAH